MHIVLKGLERIVSPFFSWYPNGVERNDAMKKMILLDIDGTLRDERLGIPDSARMAVEKLMKAGHVPCLCTGRSKSMIQEDVWSLGIPHVIAGGGCYIERNGRILKDSVLDTAKVSQLYQLLKDSDAAVSMESKDMLFMNHKAVDILNHMNDQKSDHCTKKQLQAYRQSEKIRYQDNFSTYRGEGIHKICLWAEESMYNAICQILQDDMKLAQSGLSAYGPYYEIIRQGCGKADAIAYLCDKLSIPNTHTIAFGDGMNDAEMLSYCGVGIAMKNSDERLFAYADAVCEDLLDDGIYKELIRRNLIES